MAKAGTVREYIDYDPTGLPLFRVTQTLTAGVVTSAVGSWYVGKSATLSAPVSTICTGVASCVPSATPTVGVHLLMGGTRIATVRAAARSVPAPALDLDPIANVLYYHRDYQGSVVGTSLRSGGVDGITGAGYRYTPYGQLDRATNVTAASDSELGYTNGLRLLWKAGTAPALPQTPGLVLLGARVYHAELKRWLQPDTVDALRYTHTGGDPVNFIDPSGRVMQDPSGTLQPYSISNWDRFGVAPSVGMAASFVAAVSSEVRRAFAAGGETAALAKIAELDQQWVARGGTDSLERAAAIGSLYAYFSSGAPQEFTRGASTPGPQGTSATQFNPASGSAFFGVVLGLPRNSQLGEHWRRPAECGRRSNLSTPVGSPIWIELSKGADSGHSDQPFRRKPITRTGKAITRGVRPLGRSTSPAFPSGSRSLSPSGAIRR